MVNRIKIALDFLKNGQSFTVDELRLEMYGFDLLTVTGWSQYLNFSNLSKSNSLNELAKVKDVFSNMVSVSDDLKSFIKNKSLKFILCYDDGGKASIEICSEINGNIKWEVEIK